MRSDDWDKEEDENDDKWQNRSDLQNQINKIIDYVELLSSRVNNLQVKYDFLLHKVSEIGASITHLENILVELKDKL